MTNACKYFIGNHDGKIPHGRQTQLEGYRMDLKEIKK
jgi:hypothetical protein